MNALKLNLDIAGSFYFEFYQDQAMQIFRNGTVHYVTIAPGRWRFSLAWDPVIGDNVIMAETQVN
jgi:hypothetical protein